MPSEPDDPVASSPLKKVFRVRLDQNLENSLKSCAKGTSLSRWAREVLLREAQACVVTVELTDEEHAAIADAAAASEIPVEEWARGVLFRETAKPPAGMGRGGHRTPHSP